MQVLISCDFQKTPTRPYSERNLTLTRTPDSDQIQHMHYLCLKEQKMLFDESVLRTSSVWNRRKTLKFSRCEILEFAPTSGISIESRQSIVAYSWRGGGRVTSPSDRTISLSREYVAQGGTPQFDLSASPPRVPHYIRLIRKSLKRERQGEKER